MDITDFAVASGLLSLFVVGFVELVRQAFNRNLQAVVTVAGAGVVGGLAGLFLLPVIGLPVGIGLGIAGSGLVTTVKNFGTGTNKELLK